MALGSMESTTLVTFMLQHGTARKVELFGSWDNFTEPYAMEHDRRRGRGAWSGCHSFRDIICDGDEEGIHEKRAGGLRMGGTYWYFYRIDDDEEFFDESQETTTACPLMPGQTLNVLEVPFDVERFGSHSRSSSQISLLNHVKTLNPEDRYVNPQPVAKPQVPKLEADASVRHIPNAPSPDAGVNRRSRRHNQRPWTVWPEYAHLRLDPWSRTRTAERLTQSAPTSPIDVTFGVLEDALELQDQGVQEAWTQSQGGRGGSRVPGSGGVRERLWDAGEIRASRIELVQSSADYLPLVVPEADDHVELIYASQWPLRAERRTPSPHPSVLRIREDDMAAAQVLEGFPGSLERGRSITNTESAQHDRSTHRRGFSSSYSSRSTGDRKREPSPLRNLVMTQEEARAVDELAIPSCVPETETDDLSSTRKTTNNHTTSSHSSRFPLRREFLPYTTSFIDTTSTDTLTKSNYIESTEGYPAFPSHNATLPTYLRGEANEMKRALQALHDQYTQERQYSPWRSEVNIPLPESPETSNEAGSDIGSPIFSSIHGDASDVGGASHRLSDLRDWPLPVNTDFSGFDFQFEQQAPLSLEQLSLHTETSSSTAVPYQLPHAQGKASYAEQSRQERQLTQAEQLLDEFEYLGAALL